MEDVCITYQVCRINNILPKKVPLLRVSFKSKGIIITTPNLFETRTIRTVHLKSTFKSFKMLWRCGVIITSQPFFKKFVLLCLRLPFVFISWLIIVSYGMKLCVFKIVRTLLYDKIQGPCNPKEVNICL